MDAYNQCVVPNPKSTLLMPAGTYLLATPITLGGSDWTFQLDGQIVVAFDPKLGGTMLHFNRISNFEFVANGGSIDGQGRLWTVNGDWNHYTGRPRLMRCENSNNVKIHGVLLIDAPMFHLTVIGNNTEVYDITVKGANHGETDGIDISGWNNHVHHCHITNRDECVTVKTPTHGILVEDIFCDNSGGCNIGSFGSEGQHAEVENVHYRNVVFVSSEGGAGIKAFPGNTGYVRNVTFESMTLSHVIYPATVNTFWCPHQVCPPDTGDLQITGITFRNITGTNLGNTRDAMVFTCSPKNPCKGIVLDHVVITSDNGGAIHNTCSNAFGTGACLTPGMTNKSWKKGF